MRIKKNLILIFLTMLLIGTSFTLGLLLTPAIAQENQQDPDAPPPGTVPGHGEFGGKKFCYNTGKQKNCDCHKMCLNGKPQNDNKCKNYCYEDHCKCRTACQS